MILTKLSVGTPFVGPEPTISTRSRRTPRSEYDVIVVGGGAMGSAAAWELSRRGRAVLLLERFAAGHAFGASHGGSRIFRYGYEDATYVRLVQEALPLWRELEADAGQPLLDLTGAVDHGRRSAIESLRTSFDACGVVYEQVSPEAAHERWPGLRFDTAVLVQPNAGRIRAADTLAALHAVAARNGVDTHCETRVLGISEHADGVRVRTESDEYFAPVAVVAAGAWTSSILGPLGIALPPLRTTEERVLHFAPIDGALDCAGWPSFIHRIAPVRYGLPTPGEGIKVGEHHAGPMCDPEPAVRGFEVDDESRSRIVDYVAQWLPGVVPEPVSEATCLYTTTPTEDFVVERFGRIVVAAGFSGHGFKFVPLIGARLADLALSRRGRAAPAQPG